MFELLRPAAFAISVLLSTWVLAGSRRRGLRPAHVFFWTAGAFLLPFIVFPVHLAVGLFRRRHRKVDQVRNEPSNDPTDSESVEPVESEPQRPSIPMRWTLPLAYMLAMFAIGGLSYYREWQSVDSHLARANRARLNYDDSKVIAEYGAALKKEDSPHIHNLLGIALMDTGAWDKALSEFQAALDGGEPDDLLLYNMGQCLQNVGRKGEAKTYFARFLEKPRCSNIELSERCKAAAQIVAQK